MIELSYFFNSIRPLFRQREMSASQTQGCTTLLTEWSVWEAQHPVLKPTIRWLGYALATTFWETSQAMQPVREVGLGRGHDYGAVKPNGQIYYGRGDVQLTYDYNYVKLGQRLGIPLYDHPDLALDPTIAAHILFEGMGYGLFTGVGLGRFFGANPALDDPVRARTIINGMDHATDIANLYRVFVRGLQPPAFSSAGV